MLALLGILYTTILLKKGRPASCRLYLAAFRSQKVIRFTPSWESLLNDELRGLRVKIARHVGTGLERGEIYKQPTGRGAKRWEQNRTPLLLTRH